MHSRWHSTFPLRNRSGHPSSRRRSPSDKSGAEVPADDEGIRFNRFYIRPGGRFISPAGETDAVMIGRMRPIVTQDEARNMAAYLIFASGGLTEFLLEYGELLELAKP